MQGKKATAPCGHEGEHVIGAYIRCIQGCAKDPHVAKQAPRRRGEVGHVEWCACRPCQVRRRVHTIVLRSVDGKDEAVIPWDGIATRVYFEGKRDTQIRHYKLLDEGGAVVADGFLNARVFKDTAMHVDIGFAICR